MRQLRFLLACCLAFWCWPVMAAGAADDPALIWPSPGTVAATKDWTIKFDRPVDSDSVNTATFQVRQNGNPVPGVTVEPGADGVSAVVKAPPGGYEPGREYVLVVSRQVRAGSGAALSREIHMRFQVQATTAAGTATLTHAGFDFSTNTFLTLENQLPGDEFLKKMDGTIVVWDPFGPWTDTASQVWFWSQVEPDYNRVADLGAGSLDSVTDATAVTFPETSPPLVPGHVYVAQCRDGYVKFKVSAVDPGQFTAQVEWAFSAAGTF